MAVKIDHACAGLTAPARRALAERYPGWAEFAAAARQASTGAPGEDFLALSAIDGVGPVAAQSIATFFREAHNRRLVDALKAAPRADVGRPPPEAVPRQRELDEARALAEALSDEVDVESLLLTDDGLGFRRPGIPLDVLAQLRKGKWAIQDQLDLHGLRRDEAREALGAFIRSADQRGLRCLRVIHGKGHGSPGREPVLKAKVHKWLAQKHEVIAFAQAAGPQGGAGAVIVLLAA